MSEIGYTHSMFTGNLRAYAQKVDDTANGGNNNGLIDGKEIEAFKTLVKKETGYTFDFSNIHQSVTKPVLIRDKNNWKYNSAMELAAEYSFVGANSKAIIGLNGGDPFHENKKSYAYVPHNSYFEQDKSEVDRQETEASKGLYKKMQEKKAKEQQEFREATKSDLEKLWDWLKSLF